MDKSNHLKTKRKSLFSKFIVLAVIILNVAFTITILSIFNNTNNEPTTLITCFFGFTTVELWSLAKIKRDKNKNDNCTQINYEVESEE